MMEEIKTDITQRSYDKQNVLWAKLSAVRLGLVDKDQVSELVRLLKNEAKVL